MTYLPVFDLDCKECDTSPVVCIIEDGSTVRSTGLCGVCFFHDRLMVDPDQWNNPHESTE